MDWQTPPDPKLDIFSIRFLHVPFYRAMRSQKKTHASLQSLGRKALDTTSCCCPNPASPPYYSRTRNLMDARLRRYLPIQENIHDVHCPVRISGSTREIRPPAHDFNLSNMDFSKIHSCPMSREWSRSLGNLGHFKTALLPVVQRGFVDYYWKSGAQ